MEVWDYNPPELLNYSFTRGNVNESSYPSNTMIHSKPYTFANTIKTSVENLGGKEIQIEDWWDRVSGKSWMDCTGNIACLTYAVRDTPINNEVVYGKIDGAGYLIHIDEIQD